MDFSAFLDQADWSFPIPIRYGPGRIAEIGQTAREFGLVNPLIVTDRGSRDLPFITALEKALAGAGLGTGLFSDVAPNPTDANVAAGKAAYLAGRHDGIIAIGGGSGMDAGKAIALVAGLRRNIWSFDFDKRPDPALTSQDFPPLICVPTTAGTGAETESTAMLTHTGRRVKGCVWHPALKPACAVLDPELTVGLPSSLTAWTGCDALVHALEAWCVPCLHPICDAVALEALRLITLALPRVLDAPGDVAARGALLTGSCLAGVSFLKGLGLVHAISHMIGAEYDTHHGLTNAVLLPAVLRFNRLAIEDRIAPVAQAMGLADTGFNSFLSAVNALLDRCAIPHSLTDLGVREEDVPRLAEKAFADAATATNPRPASVAEIAALITAALEPVR